MWPKEDDELYMEALKKHVCSMIHLSAAFPTKYAPAPCSHS